MDAAAVEALTERLNPIIVKEVRQGLRTKIFWIAFGLMLLSCFVISVVAYGTSLDARVSRPGQAFFFAYFLCLSVVHFFVIPYSAYRSLAREREEETWVLLSLTGIGARRIIRGKVGSFLAQALLYGSAVLPFLLFSYYLNGIDLPTILIVTLLGGTYTVFLTCVAVSAASIADSRLMRGLVHFGVLGALLFGAGVGLSAAGQLAFDSAQLFREKEFKYVLGAALWAMVTYGLLMYQAATARLSLPTEDYAKGPRLALLLQMAGSAAIAVYIWFFEGKDHEIPLVFQMLMMLGTFGVGVFMLSGADAVHEVHYRRGGWSLLRPGTVRALRFVALLVGGITALWLVLYSFSPDLPGDAAPGMYFILATAAYVLMYLSAPIVIARLSGVWALSTPAGVRVLTLVLGVLGVGLPPLVALVVGAKPEDPALNLFNPIIGSVNFVDRPWTADRYVMGPGSLIAVVGVALILTFTADLLLSSRERQARELRTRTGP